MKSFAPQPWMDEAACRTAPRSDFFPPVNLQNGEPYSEAGKAAVERAKAVCAACPVIEQCREYAIYEQHGVWFGTTPAERRKLLNGRLWQLRQAQALAPRTCKDPACGKTFVPKRARQVVCGKTCKTNYQSPWDYSRPLNKRARAERSAVA